ncbi:3-oxoacyl-reductase [Xylaria bambusicola]|uniref:3-oxoacyl-reductase n=1 Tax=Xylaria bambusicola TaxID=326684 RepID=UPI0020080ACB|nr:3-oxoacyl-reductase [Xylaria bambusicola]KAI0509767.1 3-oxoacyl-reductase [Xylaria bambusicola]
MLSLKGRVAVITGGSRGIGLAFCQGLAEAGADIAIFDIISPSPAFEKISTDYSVRTKSYEVDVTSLSSLEAGFASVAADFDGKLDIFVACAGINKMVEFLNTTEADLDHLLNVNVKGVYFGAQLATKAMISNGTTCGSIILVASIASYITIRSLSQPAYCGTKGAVRALVAPMAAELSKHGIRVNSISPGYVKTEMTAPFPHMLEIWKGEIMNGRLAEPDDLKGACVFLASDASRYCTGSDILVDGGVTKW